jgi:hypothetical protein
MTLMPDVDPVLGTTPVAGIAESHQSTVAVILRAVGLGLFTTAEADMLIDRVRAVAGPAPVAVAMSVVAAFQPR